MAQKETQKGVSRLDRAMQELAEDKVIKEEYGDREVASLLVTYFATKGFLKKAEEKGVMVVQGFEW